MNMVFLIYMNRSGSTLLAQLSDNYKEVGATREANFPIDLVKVDRASMLNSLEVRSPLLDHKLLEFAATLPADWVFRKRIRKGAIRGLVPDSVLSRPKKGFGVPLHSWFKGNCQDYLREVIT